MDNKRGRKKIEDILREPLTRHRFILNSKLRAAQREDEPEPFTAETLKSFAEGIYSTDESFDKEVENMLQAVQTGKAPQSPKFDTPETQLIWGAGIAYLSLNPDQMKTWTKPVEDGDLSKTEFWKDVVETRVAYQELLSHAHHVREALRDKNTKYGWSDPGTGFSYDREKNLINIDLMQSMIVGFEHARADVYREIGHSLLSLSYPKRMQELFKEMRPLLKKSRLAQMKKGPQLKPEEYKQLRLLSAEWQLRHMMFSSAEENVANRFVSNIGQQVLQDYSVSLNNTAVTFRAVGLTRLPANDNDSEDLRRYMNLCNTVQLSFFQNNGLFEDTEEGWSKVGIDTGLIRKTSTRKQLPEGQQGDDEGMGHPDFQCLRELCGGPKGLENLQPKQHERLYGWENLTGRVTRADRDRKAIIDQIWEEYAEDLIQSILKNANDQIDQQLKEAQEKQKQKGEQEGEEQEGEEQEGEEQDGPEGQEGSGSGKGKKQKKDKSKKQDKKNQKRGKPQGDPDDMEEDDGEGGEGQEKKDKKSQKDKNKKEKGDKGEKGDPEEQEGSEKGDGQEGEEQEADGEKQDGEGAEGKLGADEEEKVPVEGAGDMPAPDAPTEVPSDEVDPNAKDPGEEGEEGEDKDSEADGEEADGEEADGKTAEELEKELEEMEEGEDGEEADAEGEEADGQKKGKKKSKSKQSSRQAGHQDGKLGDLARKDWNEYNKRITELAGPISRVRKLFKAIQERQLQRKQAMSRTLDILPQNGEVKERFNVEAHRDLTIKKATGNVEEKDLKRFHVDETKMTPTEIDIVIAIDGSGSMNGVPINAALQASAIMFEAAAGKDMRMNVYVMMWGNQDPPIIIKPGDDRVKIGKAMEAARGGLNSGTDLAPGISKIAKTIGEQRGKSGTLSGFTHVLILSDGDMFDMAPAMDKIQTMFEYSDKVTFDAAIITANKGTGMERMAKDIKGAKPFQDMGVVLGDNPDEVPLAIVGLLLEKVRKCGSFTAVPNNQKRRAMKKAHNKMDPKR